MTDLKYILKLLHTLT